MSHDIGPNIAAEGLDQVIRGNHHLRWRGNGKKEKGEEGSETHGCSFGFEFEFAISEPDENLFKMS